MRVGAVVVSYNSEQDLPACLQALTESAVKDIVVVDNVSSDDSVAIARQWSTVVVKNSANVGFGAAVNRGAEELTAVDALLLVNPDCVISQEMVDRLAASLAERPELAAIVPVMQYLDGEYGISGGAEVSIHKEIVSRTGLDALAGQRVRRAMLMFWRRFGWPRLLGYLDVEPGDGVVDVAWVSGFCFLVRTEAFHEVGGFDSDFFMYFEDVDLCKRLRARSWTVAIDKTAVAVHSESSSSLRAGKSRLYQSGLRTYFDKHGNRLEKVLAKCIVGRG